MKILLIKSKAYIPTDKLMKFHDNFVKQVASGVVVIPEYFDAEVLDIPSGIDVIVESYPEVRPELISKKFNIPKLSHCEED